MAKLNLYTNVTPNADYVHYYFTSLADFKTELSTHLLTQIDFNTFRINGGVVSIKIDTTITLANYKNVTYIINEYDGVCYHVVEATTQSEYIIYNISVDYWGTYIAQATINNLHITRCNRNVGVGEYDEISVTDTNTYNRFEMTAAEKQGGLNYYKLANVYIVAAISVNVKQGGSYSVTASKLYAWNVKELYDDLKTLDAQTFEHLNGIVGALSVVAGIHDAVGSWGTGVDATVTRVWIIDEALLYGAQASNKWHSGVEFKSRSYFKPSTDIVTEPYEVFYQSCEKSFTLTIDPNKNYYVGNLYNGLRLNRITDTATIVYKSFIKNDTIEVVVKQGENEKDITDLFETQVTTNEGDFTQLSGIKHILNVGVQSLAAVATSNPAAAVGAFATAISPLLSKKPQGHRIGNGDGLLTFYALAGNPAAYCSARYPYGYTTAESVDNESKHANVRGAKFNEYTDITTACGATLLGSGTETNTYIEGEANVINVPQVAQEVIKSKLATGVYIKKLGS